MGKTFNDAIQDFVQFMGEHTSFDDFVAEAMTDIQDDLVEQLIAEIESAKLIQPTDKTFDIQLDYDNLREWLRNYYILEKR